MFINKRRIRCGEHKKNGGKNGRTIAINEISTTFSSYDDYILVKSTSQVFFLENCGIFMENCPPYQNYFSLSECRKLQIEQHLNKNSAKKAKTFVGISQVEGYLEEKKLQKEIFLKHITHFGQKIDSFVKKRILFFTKKSKMD